jgi:hypothetical protein
MESDRHLVKNLLDERKYQDAINTGIQLLKEKIPQDEEFWIHAYMATAYFRIAQYEESTSILDELLRKIGNSGRFELAAYSHY